MIAIHCELLLHPTSTQSLHHIAVKFGIEWRNNKEIRTLRCGLDLCQYGITRRSFLTRLCHTHYMSQLSAGSSKDGDKGTYCQVAKHDDCLMQH